MNHIFGMAPLFSAQKMIKEVGSSDGHVLIAEDSCLLSTRATRARLREYVEDHGTSWLGYNYRNVGRLTAHAMEGCLIKNRVVTL